VIVNISSIREERGAALHFTGTQEIPPANFEGITLKPTAPVEVKGRVTNAGEGFLVEATLLLAYQANCDRCLQKFNQTQKIEFKEEFVAGRNSSDETVYSFSGELLDLTKCLSDQIMLALPMKLLCSPTCRGFCTACGANLNFETCRCPKRQTNHQFEILKNLLAPEGGGESGKSQKQDLPDPKKITSRQLESDSPEHRSMSPMS
jgi:uncharacterized protein